MTKDGKTVWPNCVVLNHPCKLWGITYRGNAVMPFFLILYHSHTAKTGLTIHYFIINHFNFHNIALLITVSSLSEDKDNILLIHV